MKWSEVEITDLSGKFYTGNQALIFVDTVCKPIAIRTTEDGLIQAYAGSIGATLDNIEVRKFLFSKLKGKATSLRFLTTVNFKRAFIPVVRAELNIFNVDSATLKVEIIYKRDQKSSSPKKFLEDSIVTVKALREGSSIPLTMPTKRGIANFGNVFPGKYTITPDYSQLKECEYDWVNESRQIVLIPSGAETIEFQVEPLYQKVQFVAHALLTIPRQVFFPEKIEITPESYVQVPITRWNKTGRKRIPAIENRTPHYWKATYNGYVEDSIDVTKRVETVKATIEIARQKTNPDPKILKVFAIPECYFQGKYGAYKTKNVSLLFDELQKTVEGEIWKDWIFVFGTVNGADDFPEFNTLGKAIPKTSKGADAYNFSPIIRGGHGGNSDISAYRHLIQKTCWASDMLNEDSLIRETGLTRPQLVGDIVAFQPTENEAILGDIVKKMLQDPVTEHLGIGKWDDLKIKVTDDITKHNMTKVVRDVREGSYPELKDALERYIDKMADNPAKRKQTDPGLGKPAVRLSVQSDVLTPTLNKSFKLVVTLLDNDGKSANATVEMNIPFTVTAPAGDIVKLTAKIEIGKSSDDSQSYTPTAHGQHLVVADCTDEIPLHKSSFFVFSRRLLGPKEDYFDYRDYVFACARKSGPLLELSAAEQLKTCKKLVFGFEICADHNKERLIRSLRTKQAGITPTIDIQFIISAGMYPTDPNIAARDGGYFFNCDGWNNPSAAGAIKITEGLGNFVKVELPGMPVHPTNPIPLYPHSVLGKGGSSNSPSKTKELAKSAEIVKLDKLLDKNVIDVIFGAGAGELHIYKVQDLPK